MDAEKELSYDNLTSEDFSISEDFDYYNGFSVSIPNQLINEVLSNEPYLLIREQIKCLVCDNINMCDIKYKYILIQHKNLTPYNVVKQLIKKKYKKKCNHIFLESFIKMNDKEFEIIWGS